MKKSVFKILLLFVVGIFISITATGQIKPPVQDTLAVYPVNPSPKDSIYVAYSYISNDGCPDFLLVKDSVVANRVYVSKRNIDNSNRICTAMVSYFAAKLNLGLLSENTQIYFNGILSKTIHWSCLMDKLGVVIEVKDNSTLIKDSLAGDIYAINNLKLAIGTLIKFNGVKIQCFTTPCYNLVNCYEVIQAPTPPCVLDKVGFVVSGIAGCEGEKFIQELSPISSSRQLYIIKGNIINSTGTVSSSLNVGDKVRFGGYLIKSDSGTNILCRTIGVATCYEVQPPDCIKDKLGVVVSVKDGSTLIKDSLTGDIYAINNLKLAVGTQIKFNGVKIQCITTPCYNLVNCYEIIQTPPPPTCIMDKIGVVVQGVGGCAGQLFIEDTSSPVMSMIRQLYKIENNVVGTGILTTDSGSVTTGASIYPIGLKVGDKVQFGGYLTKNDSSMVNSCYTVGVATCYKLIDTPACVMDKIGLVVPGIDGCTGKLFIQEYSPISSARQLYSIKEVPVPNSTGTTLTGLKAGDKVKFGGYLTKNDSSVSVLCYTVGIATCYEVINTESTYTLSGTVLAGTELIKSGYAALFRKGYYKALTTTKINSGVFTFANLPKAEYTVYAMPDLSTYKNYLPTFFINKLKYKNADYLTLNDSNKNMVINLREFIRTKGTGKITGNVFFETYSLQDSVLAKTGLSNTINLTGNIAMNTAVILNNSANEPVAWTMTDTNGYYVFENIALSTYKVVAETATAIAESVVSITDNNSVSNADLLLKNQQNNTGFDRIAEDVIVNIYPNPVADKLNIEISNQTTLYIYNTMGKLVFNKELKSGINSIDISMVGKGIYVAKTGKNTVRIVKN